MADIDAESGQSKGNEKSVSIFVNQDEHHVPKDKISYDEVVSLYLSDGGSSSTEYLIKYSRGQSANVSGTLAPGDEVMVKNGMRFRVSSTGES